MTGQFRSFLEVQLDEIVDLVTDQGVEAAGLREEGLKRLQELNNVLLEAGSWFLDRPSEPEQPSAVRA